jgi:hypothetical protein
MFVGAHWSIPASRRQLYQGLWRSIDQAAPGDNHLVSGGALALQESWIHVLVVILCHYTVQKNKNHPHHMHPILSEKPEALLNLVAGHCAPIRLSADRLSRQDGAKYSFMVAGVAETLCDNSSTLENG